MNKIVFLVVFILAIALTCFAQSNSSESLTITTYYPSPYGVYGVLRLNPRTKPATCQEGEITYDNAVGKEGLYYCDKTKAWQSLVVTAAPTSAPTSAPTAPPAGPTGPLFGSVHTTKDCSSAGGTPIDNPAGFGLPICQFHGPFSDPCPQGACSLIASTGQPPAPALPCPGGWTPFQSWSETSPVNRVPCYGGGCGGGPCNTGSHGWANAAWEKCSSHCWVGPCYAGCCSDYFNFAQIVKLGCY